MHIVWRRSSRAILFTASVVACWACSGSALPPAQGPSAYRTQVLADQPVGYWRLDEPSGSVAFDQTMNANHGKISRGITLKYPGTSGDDKDTAMQFDGINGELVVPASPSLQMPARSITIEAWVKPLEIQPDNAVILAKGTTGVQTEYGLELVNGIPAYQSVVELYVSQMPPLPARVWSHIAVSVLNNSMGTFYLNGKVADTFQARTGHLVTSSTQPVTIGNEAKASTHFFGAIDEVVIYPYTLTAEQLAKHYSLATQTTH